MTNPQEIEAGQYSRFYKRYGDPTIGLHKAYDPWLEDMSSRPGSKLQPFNFDITSHPEQGIYMPKVDAQTIFPNLPDSLYYLGFRLRLMRSIGVVATQKLLHQLHEHPASESDSTTLPDRLNNNHAQGKNTLVVTSHINFQEMGYVKALRHLAKQDRDLINKNGVVLNKLMTRQEYRGKKLTNQFKPLGNVYFSSPKSLSAEKYGIPDSASDLTNALFKKVLLPDLKAGGLELDIALSGSEVKPVLDEDGVFEHYRIPEIHQSSAKLVEDFDDAVAITLVGPPVLEDWHLRVHDIIDVQQMLKSYNYAQITDLIYAEIVQDLEELTGKDVQYSSVSSRLGKIAATGFSKS